MTRFDETNRRGWLRLTSAGLVGVLTGCGGPRGDVPLPPEAIHEAVLRDVGELCRVYQLTKKKPPAKLTDLQAVAEGTPSGYEALRSGDVVLRHGATLPDTNEDPGQTPSEEILAYSREVPEKGGAVLMLDRTVRTMSAEQFKAAKLAGKD